MSLNNDSQREESTFPIRSFCERCALYVGRLANTTFATRFLIEEPRYLTLLRHDSTATS